jgi:aspartyl protease family protein
MFDQRPIRTTLLLALAIGFAGGARANLGSVMDTLVPVDAGSASTASTRPTSSPLAAGHKVRRDPDGLFYVHALVNGKPVRFLVDTGASVVVLTAADARAVGAEVEDEKFGHRVSTVGGSTPMAWTTIQSLELAGHEVRDLRAAVVKDGLGVSLLGQNMLTELNSLIISEDSLSMQ